MGLILVGFSPVAACARLERAAVSSHRCVAFIITSNKNTFKTPSKLLQCIVGAVSISSSGCIARLEIIVCRAVAGSSVSENKVPTILQDCVSIFPK